MSLQAIFPPGPSLTSGVWGGRGPRVKGGVGAPPEGLALDPGWPPLGWLAGRAWEENKSFRELLDPNPRGVEKERALSGSVARLFGTGSSNWEE